MISVILPKNGVEFGLELGLVEVSLLIGVSVRSFARTTAHSNLFYTITHCLGLFSFSKFLQFEVCRS